MIRHFRLGFALFVAGCAGASTRPEGPLDRLIAKTNAYTSFHLRAEISDGKQSVPIEMAFRAPDRAILKYGAVATTIHAGGSAHHFLRGTYYSLDYTQEIAALRARYPGLAIGPAPDAVFTLGDGVRALLSVGRLGARLGWLEDLGTYTAEGNVYRHGQTEIHLREDGFIERTSIAGTTFALKEVQINTALPDSLFALPSTQGLQDTTERMRADQVRGLEEVYHRWILKTSADDETLNAMLAVDLGRQYEPEKMALLLRDSVKKSLTAFHVLHPDARPDVVKDKIAIEHGKAMGAVDLMEEEIQREYEKRLDGYFRGMAVPPPQKEMLDIARRWKAGVRRQVEEQIRGRFEEVFEAVRKE